jgi:hypothetical protein
MQFNIVQLERETESGCVTTIHWSADKTDGDYHGYTYSSLGIEKKDPSDESFIPFNELSMEQVIEWIENKLGEEELQRIEESLDAQIESQKNPPVSYGLPWSNTSEVVIPA